MSRYKCQRLLSSLLNKFKTFLGLTDAVLIGWIGNVHSCYW